jgi:hypothetical protein
LWKARLWICINSWFNQFSNEDVISSFSTIKWGKTLTSRLRIIFQGSKTKTRRWFLNR